MYRAAKEEDIIDLVDSDDERIQKVGDPIHFVGKMKSYMCCVYCDHIICQKSEHFQVTRNTFTPSMWIYLWTGPINRVHRYIARQVEFEAEILKKKRENKNTPCLRFQAEIYLQIWQQLVDLFLTS